MEYEDFMEKWLKQVKSISTNMSVADKARITKAGAKVFKKELEAETRSKHYSHHDDKVYGHMADSVVFKNTNIDGIKDGTSIVGFDHYHATNARRLNDGTKFYVGDHFITNLRPKVIDKVLKAEHEEYQKVLKKQKEV
ncbi:HK97 gp10 family phage protein [Pediococcus acidilactici]|jgi:hypothetical protein|uniref:HK97 gp10 family phage protein n=1 Tax=Pediococcus acidilactici TaxID=1254 RepID=UPI001913072C|nr:HK97 gp10 family phage protein [Pediococcus acidilactici]MCH4101047.1 HK97 gp10 family phage protein [Pediococcus acidilactici]QQP82646.1 HK97 gp10 family phage protein [Pediococcus acidilactici]